MARAATTRLGNYRGLAWLSGSFLMLFVAAPIVWALSTSLKTEVNAVTFPPVLIPNPLSLAAYLSVFTDRVFPVELFNSVLYSVGAVGLALLVGLPAGYAAARFPFRGKRVIMLVLLGASMVPAVALLVPTYYLLDRLGLLNAEIVVIIISAAHIAPQTVWFISNFIETVPPEIDEAALVDGASRPQIVVRLILPLIRHGIAAICVLGIIQTWNDYITVAVFAPQITKRTLQVALVNQVFDAVGISWSTTMAFSIVSSLPIILIFVLAQRWFVAGLTAGTVKG